MSLAQGYGGVFSHCQILTGPYKIRAGAARARPGRESAL